MKAPSTDGVSVSFCAVSGEQHYWVSVSFCAVSGEQHSEDESISQGLGFRIRRVLV